jgi:hypothetical protein
MQESYIEKPVVYRCDMRTWYILAACLYIVCSLMMSVSPNGHTMLVALLIGILVATPFALLFVIPFKIRKLSIFHDHMIYRSLAGTKELPFHDIKGFTVCNMGIPVALIRIKSNSDFRCFIALEMYTEEQLSVVRNNKTKIFPLLDWLDSKWPRIDEPVNLKNKK